MTSKVWINIRSLEFGGNSSVLLSAKPRNIFGQDESVYNQFSFGSRRFVASSGDRVFLPKYDGVGATVPSTEECR